MIQIREWERATRCDRCNKNIHRFLEVQLTGNRYWLPEQTLQLCQDCSMDLVDTCKYEFAQLDLFP